MFSTLDKTDYLNGRRIISVPKIEYERAELNDGERIKQVIDSFGYLNSDSPARKKIIVSEEFDFRMGNLNIIYGMSGSGKSSILRTIRTLLYEGDYLTDLPDEKDDDFLINLVGKDINESIKILSQVGLGEGNLFLRKCCQLSDGQKFRMRLALHLSKPHGRIVYIDEFNSSLDITTAIFLAKSLSKVLIKNGLYGFICCNNMEVVRAFHADTLIEIGLDKKITVSYPKKIITKMQTSQVTLKRGNVQDYQLFKKYHYLDIEDRINQSEIVIATNKDLKIGINVFVRPLSNRREPLHPYFQLINQKMTVSYRTVVHPEYRGCGVGKLLAVDAPKILGYEIVDDRSTLYRFAKIPLYWGYIEQPYPYFNHRPFYDALNKYVENNGFDPNKMIFREYCEIMIEKLGVNKLAELSKADEDERHKAQLIYYCNIMDKCGYPYAGDKDELCEILCSVDTPASNKEKLIKALIKHKQPYYGCFYKNLTMEEN